MDTVCLLMRSAKKRQLELCMGLKEASKCQELVELERGAGVEREDPGDAAFGHGVGGL